LLAWISSIALHLALGLLLYLKGGAALKPGEAQSYQPTTPVGRATRLAEAQQQVEKLQQIEKALQQIQQGKPEQSGLTEKPVPPSVPSPHQAVNQKIAPADHRIAQAQQISQAQQVAHQAQANASTALKNAQQAILPTSSSPSISALRELAKASISLQEAKDAQAKAAVTQEKMKQDAGQRPLSSKIQEALKKAESKQEAARQAQQKAEQELQKARKLAAHTAGTKASQDQSLPSEKPGLPGKQPGKTTQNAALRSSLKRAEMAAKLAAKMQEDARAVQQRVQSELGRIQKQVAQAKEQGARQVKPTPSPKVAGTEKHGQNQTKNRAEGNQSAVAHQQNQQKSSSPTIPHGVSPGLPHPGNQWMPGQGTRTASTNAPGNPTQPSALAPPSAPASGNTANTNANQPRDLASAYQTAQETQAHIAETYREVRASQLARIEGISPGEALKRTDTVPFTPEKLSLGPGASLATERAAQRELTTMVARSERLLDQAQHQAGSGAMSLLAQMRKSAVEGAGHMKDMTPFMATDKPATGTERASLPGDPTHLAPPPAPAIPPGLVNRVTFGRRVAASGAAPSDWMSVDTWYTIGPFPNPERKNINTPFPPEAVVDLDATYPGKDGRMVRWQFLQASRPDVVPNIPEEYAIYYAYTELWFEQPMDLWIAIGSDDKSTLWIEDQLVWMSSDVLKGWQIGEGLRYVHFKKGRNRILLRIENGWRGVAFSMTLALKSPQGVDARQQLK
jgi:hypothetical protein